ncbi:MAG: hypothetical protein ACLR0N_00895 [Bilophila wadsworthia]
MRTLAPSAPGYRPLYEGGPAERDEATIGHGLAVAAGGVREAVLRAAWDARLGAELRTIRPLFAQHLGDAGIGSVSKFLTAIPHLPNGCIAQA